MSISITNRHAKTSCSNVEVRQEFHLSAWRNYQPGHKFSYFFLLRSKLVYKLQNQIHSHVPILTYFTTDALRSYFHINRRRTNSIADGSRKTILKRERQRSRIAKVCGSRFLL